MRPMNIIAVSIVAVLAGIASSCGVIKELSEALPNLSRCSFKITGVSDLQVAGVPLAGKTQLSIIDGAKVLAVFTRGELPASFTLNVAAQNPNDGTGGTRKSTATMTSFAWNLRLDDTPTISGDIPEPIMIPASGQQTVIPLRMNLDLLKFFKDKGYDKILNLALALGGAQGSSSRITLRATPTIKTDFGSLTYPGEIDIIDKEFRGK